MTTIKDEIDKLILSLEGSNNTWVATRNTLLKRVKGLNLETFDVIVANLIINQKALIKWLQEYRQKIESSER